ncbi:MAG: hypothetical protein PHU63_04680 [Candidatus ainarchaeum sp.]|nr:hypothetical protein [Candidatus ainarchaeum sp.]
MMFKRAMQLPFAWIFASIIGAFILFLSIYIGVKLINTGGVQADYEIAEKIGILLGPLETGFQSSQKNDMEIPVSIRIYSECDESGNFGEQKIKVSQFLLKKWTDSNAIVSFQNRYIFSGDYSEGKKFFIFTKQFEMPFKVADLVYLSSSEENYCFMNAPKNVENELKTLGQENIATSDCPDNSINICFSHGSSCDIEVEYSQKVVIKGSDRMYFEGDALMYAAIFSEKGIYECQVKRLMKRLGELSLLYRDKATLISNKCPSNLNLELLSVAAGNIQDSKSLSVVGKIAEDINKNNEIAYCKIW